MPPLVIPVVVVAVNVFTCRCYVVVVNIGVVDVDRLTGEGRDRYDNVVVVRFWILDKDEGVR